MKESEQTKFLRWGIPGWVMFLAFVSFATVDIVFSPSSFNNALVQTYFLLAEAVDVDSTASAIVVLLVAAAGIPLGFIIYQIYFYIRWNSPFSKNGLLAPFIVGRLNDLEKTLEGLKTEQIVGGDPWRRDWTEHPLYSHDHGWKWRYIENFFLEIIQHLDNSVAGVSLYSRYRYLMDLMHAVGASLFGIYIGFLGYVLLKVKTDNISLSIILSIGGFFLLILLILIEIEDKAKKEHFRNSSVLGAGNWTSHYQISNPSAFYIIILFTFLYLGSPSPYNVNFTEKHLLFRLAVIVLVSVAWWLSSKLPWKQIISEFVTFLFLGGIALTISQFLRVESFFKPEWWNIGWVVFLFLLLNMIFVKNRQNIRDDLIAMQNYTMKRYFADSIRFDGDLSVNTDGRKAKTASKKKRG